MPKAAIAYERAVDEFAKAMKARLRQKARQGYSGWNQVATDKSVELCVQTKLARHFRQVHFYAKYKETVDLANLAMMLWYAKENHGAGAQ